MVLPGIMSERPRPRSCRNLSAEFDAVLVAAGVPIEPPEIVENRENLFVEELLNSSVERFRDRWGYDTNADRPVEGSNWEWEPINRPSQNDVGVEQEGDASPGQEGDVNQEHEDDANQVEEVGVDLNPVQEGVSQEEEGDDKGEAD